MKQKKKKRLIHQFNQVVEHCALPLCISRLVIAPKFALGQLKDDLDHGFRVCVNVLINKYPKPNASTVPLATDEIKKCHGINYYLQADGFRLTGQSLCVRKLNALQHFIHPTEFIGGTG
jgi:hypothetical protein